MLLRSLTRLCTRRPELVAGWSSKEQIETNNAMLRNVVEPIVRTASNFRHISILQGTKIYGVHLRPIPIPARERDARKDHENFFFDHENYVREMGAQHGFNYTALRPQLVTGPTPGALNVLPAIGVYAAIRREKGEPFGFLATCKIAGEEFFKAAARRFIAAEPPRSPIMMFYGDAFPSYLAEFAPARSVPYLADVARLEAARTRAYHAADAKPLTRDALAAAPLDTLTGMRFTLHPSLEIVSSSYPIVTIFAMNSGLMELGPIADWRGEDALVIRPEYEVEVRRLSPGARIFLENLADKKEFGEAAGVASAASADFDLAENLAALFSGLAVAMTRGRTEDGPR
jgi:Putative DNA-binding domain